MRSLIAKDEIAFFQRKGNKLLSEIFENSNWYPECHSKVKEKMEYVLSIITTKT